MSVYLAELIGTMILIIFGGGVVANVSLNKSKAQGAGWIVVALGWGFAVAMAIYAVGQFSGAHINPAVTLGLASVGEFAWAQVPGYIIAQLIGAALGGVVVYLHFLGHWKETEDSNTKLGVFSTDPAVPNRFNNFLSEFIGTAVLVGGILGIGANQFTEGLNPLIVGFLILAIGLSLGGTTGYAINPARDLGPRIAHALLPIPGKRDSNWSYAWIPVVAPAAGGVFGAMVYRSFFLGEGAMALMIYSVVVAVFLGSLYYMGKRSAKSIMSNPEVKN
ncbi:aquaporin family protein [Marinococcus halophilus]|uniref:Glycerol uptake facilitator protein n=1 Tax=Marinococcus halophilus TaxID=1371 RepID=A0A510Y8K2_MARHA|nr:MIP/aquaporin family protein [Marinococcus halophilus]OZT79308.1 aquaporin family protein [Marinococcus halophilus]GEK59704.1 glycerol uptake facilitator protein [Marinococcus halophilus]